MSNHVLDELRGLLLGDKEKSYARYRAPEPELIVELLPIMQKYLLERAFDVLTRFPSVMRLSRIGSKAERARLFRIFAENLSSFPEKGLEYQFEKMLYEFPELIDYLPEAMLDEVLPFVRTMGNPITKIKVLNRLVSRLADNKKVNVINEILKHTKKVDSQQIGKIVPNLAPTWMDEPLRSQFFENALVLIQRLPSSEKLKLLAEAVPNLSKHLLSTVLDIVEGLDARHRTWVRAVLVPYLEDPIKTETIEMVLDGLESCLECQYPELTLELVNVIGEMGLPEPVRNKVLLKCLYAIEKNGYSETVRYITALVPYLTKDATTNALAVAKRISNNWWRARALSVLYPILSIEEQKTITDEVEAVSSKRIHKLLMQLPKRDRVALLENVLTQFDYAWGGAPAPPSPPDMFMKAGRLDAKDLHCSIRLREVSSARKKGPPKKERVINTGFSPQTEAKEIMDPKMPLAPGRSYYFWFEIGKPLDRALEETPDILDFEHLPSDARLKVALFAYENEIEITPSKDVGEVQVMSDGIVKVVRHVVVPDCIPADDEILEKRLFFPVHLANKEGVFRLRCNIYYEQILVHSKLIQIRVSSKQKRFSKNVLKTTTEYSISKSINPNFLVRMKPQKLSIMLNDNNDGTHCLRLFGEHEFKSGASFNAQELKYLIKKARGALRCASWNDENQWKKGKKYRYKGKANVSLLKEDLISFAIRGYRFYVGLTQKIASGIPKVKELKMLTLKPAILEFVIKDKTEASNYMFPTSMIYDYPLNTSLSRKKYSLCPSFLKALEEDNPLEKTKCFNGDCPSRSDDKVICPSGFWGFRHSIGMPLGSASETNCEMLYGQNPEITISVFSGFKEWPQHKKALKKRISQTVWNLSDTRQDTLTKLKTTNPHVVYFYCHGGLKGGIPYIKVGGENEKFGITPENLFNEEIWWQSPQPLVFINGCHTTALEPKMALNFVTSFIKTHHASGVIGTEITIFHPLARAFAEECLHLFLIEEKSIGDAVRETRLKLLKQGNPLGLVYNAYSNASLRLKKAS